MFHSLCIYNMSFPVFNHQLIFEQLFRQDLQDLTDIKNSIIRITETANRREHGEHKTAENAEKE